jgi:type IV secretory pathway protease TraF
MTDARGTSPGRGCLRGGLLALLFVALVVLLLRAFVGDLYRISSTSMEPCLRQGEWVLVRYDRSPPERWELVVLSLPGEEDALVKRVVGLPLERVQLAAGDLLVDGSRPPLSSARPAPIPIPAAGWRADPEGVARWTFDGPAAEVDALDLAALDPRALARVPGPVRDDVPEDGRVARAGEHEVGDLVIEVTVEVAEAGEGAALALGLSEQGDLFWLVLETEPGSGGRRATMARLRRSRVEAPAEHEELAFAPLAVPLELGAEPFPLRLANVDNHLRAWLRGKLVFELAYEANRFAAGDAAYLGASPGPRAWAGGAAVRASFRLALARDLHWVAEGRFAVAQPLQLGPDELFVLGDHSSHSRDGRECGPIPLEHLVGRPVRVV